MRGMSPSFDDASGAEIAAFIITLAVVDLDAGAGCMDKLEIAGLGVSADHDSHMAYAASATTARKEDEVAGLKLLTLHGATLGVLGLGG